MSEIFNNPNSHFTVTNIQDPETGEQFPVLIPPKRKVHTNGFFMADQVAFILISQMDLSKEQMKILFFMMGMMDYENKITVTQKEICECLNLQKTNVSRGIKGLMEKGLLEKDEKIGNSFIYRLNHEFGWKGRAASLLEAKRMSRQNNGQQTIKGKVGAYQQKKDITLSRKVMPKLPELP